MLIQLAAVKVWLCATLILALYCCNVYLFHHYPNVTDGNFNWRLGTRSQAALEILGEHAICWSAVEYFSGTFCSWILMSTVRTRLSSFCEKKIETSNP